MVYPLPAKLKNLAENLIYIINPKDLKAPSLLIRCVAAY